MANAFASLGATVARGAVKRGRSVISSLLSLDEPQYSFNWEVSLPTIKTINYVPIVEQSNLPIPSISASTYYDGGFIKSFPDVESIEDLTLTLFVDARGKVFEYLEKWRQFVKAKDGTYGYPTSYEYPVICRLKDKFTKTVVQITYKGFPVGTSVSDLSYTNSDRVKITQSFALNSYKLDRKGTLVENVSGAIIKTASSIARRIL